MAYSQSPKSPLAKALKGKQHNLPEHLKAKIEAAPESPVKKKGDAPSRKKSLGYYNKANKTGTGAAAGGGMTAKGTAEYRRNNPGSKLKTAVTGKVKAGSKAAGRRKSFCARSKGWTGERGKAARSRWKC